MELQVITCINLYRKPKLFFLVITSVMELQVNLYFDNIICIRIYITIVLGYSWSVVTTASDHDPNQYGCGCWCWCCPPLLRSQVAYLRIDPRGITPARRHRRGLAECFLSCKRAEHGAWGLGAWPGAPRVHFGLTGS